MEQESLSLELQLDTDKSSKAVLGESINWPVVNILEPAAGYFLRFSCDKPKLTTEVGLMMPASNLGLGILDSFLFTEEGVVAGAEALLLLTLAAVEAATG